MITYPSPVKLVHWIYRKTFRLNWTLWENRVGRYAFTVFVYERIRSACNFLVSRLRRQSSDVTKLRSTSSLPFSTSFERNFCEATGITIKFGYIIDTRISNFVIRERDELFDVCERTSLCSTLDDGSSLFKERSIEFSASFLPYSLSLRFLEWKYREINIFKTMFSLSFFFFEKRNLITPINLF